MRRSVGMVLGESRGELPLVDLHYLLGAALGRDRAFLLAHPEYELSGRQWRRWKRFRKRRLQGVPAAYITGKKEFYGISLKVNRHTLVPRPETELLVDEIIRLRPRSVLDMGTGSGCIAVALALNLPDCTITAVDVSRRALSVARQNARRHLCDTRIRFFWSNYFSEIGQTRYDIIASNPPYVREGDTEYLEPDVADHEPVLALYAGPDGLEAYREILGSAAEHLTPGGFLVLELSPEIADDLRILGDRCGFRIEKVERDLAGNERLIVFSS
jgi:release factor glutamine methyltransferase